jgi:hypothetical protein
MTTSFLCHCSRVEYHASIDGFLENDPKKYAPDGGASSRGRFFIIWQLYITFSAKIKALWRCETVASDLPPAKSLTTVNYNNR